MGLKTSDLLLKIVQIWVFGQKIESEQSEQSEEDESDCSDGIFFGQKLKSEQSEQSWEEGRRRVGFCQNLIGVLFLSHLIKKHSDLIKKQKSKSHKKYDFRYNVL